MRKNYVNASKAMFAFIAAGQIFKANEILETNERPSSANSDQTVLLTMIGCQPENPAHFAKCEEKGYFPYFTVAGEVEEGKTYVSGINPKSGNFILTPMFVGREEKKEEKPKNP